MHDKSSIKLLGNSELTLHTLGRHLMAADSDIDLVNPSNFVTYLGLKYASMGDPRLDGNYRIDDKHNFFIPGIPGGPRWGEVIR